MENCEVNWNNFWKEVLRKLNNKRLRESLKTKEHRDEKKIKTLDNVIGYIQKKI